METLKRNWLRAIGVLTLALGMFYVVKAMDHNTLKTSEPEELHWFQIDGAYTDTDAVSPSNASYINSNPIPPAGTGCNGTAKQCVSGFLESQTVVVGGVRMLNGAQTPAEVAYYKN